MLLMCFMIPSKHASLEATFTARAAGSPLVDVAPDAVAAAHEPHEPHEPNQLERLDLHLQSAALAAASVGINLDEFLRQAWSAYVDARPGLREHLADTQLAHQIQELRAAGKVGLA
jgi:hypothetical protein